LIKYLRVLAVADIHSPRYLQLFIASLSRVDTKTVDLVVLAGDSVDRGRVEAFKPVNEVLQRLFSDKPVVAVFGNEEYFDREAEFPKHYPSIHWINDSCLEIDVKGIKLCIVGSRGVLKRPTHWQSRHIPNIHQLYRERLEKLRNLLRDARKRCEVVMLVTHYASSMTTVRGEPPNILQYLGYPLIESLSPEERPDIAIHGHAHNAKVLNARIGTTEVYNVSLPAKRGVTVIDYTYARLV